MAQQHQKSQRKQKRMFGHSLKKKNRKRKNKQTQVPTLKEQGTLYETPESKANIIADKYSQTQLITRDLTNQATAREVNDEYTNFTSDNMPTPNIENTSPHKVLKIIRKMKPTKATGEDGIMALALKTLPRKMIAQLHSYRMPS